MRISLQKQGAWNTNKVVKFGILQKLSAIVVESLHPYDKAPVLVTASCMLGTYM